MEISNQLSNVFQAITDQVQEKTSKELSDQFSGVFDSISDQVHEQATKELTTFVTQHVNIDVAKMVHDHIADKLGDFANSSADTEPRSSIVSADISNRLGSIFESRSKALQDQITKEITNHLTKASAAIVNQVQDQVTRELTSLVTQQFARMDLVKIIRDYISNKLQDQIGDFSFPEASIPGTAIDQSSLLISGDRVCGGLIKQFSSSGIDDRATTCQVTVLDTHVVVESPILTTGIEVRGDMVVTGNVKISGTVPEDSPLFEKITNKVVSTIQADLNEDLFSGFSDLIYKNIKEQGIEFDLVSIKGSPVLTDTALGPSVVNSNLQKVGELGELQVKGESLLGRTLYVSNKRVGINTLEPSSALSVWDEDVEIVAGKRSQGLGYLGTLRNTGLVIGANNKENLSVDPDGSVTINDLRLGALPISTASAAPNWSGRAGEIVFNDNPAIGLPIGWVCIEGHRWAHFGIIQE